MTSSRASATRPPLFVRHRKELADLRQFPGAARDFWGRYLQCLAGVTTASKAMLVLQDAAQPSTWKRIGDWPPSLPPSRLITVFHTQVEELAARATREPGVRVMLTEPGSARTVIGERT